MREFVSLGQLTRAEKRSTGRLKLLKQSRELPYLTHISRQVKKSSHRDEVAEGDFSNHHADFSSLAAKITFRTNTCILIKNNLLT